jgi:anti-sigma factor RsiW
MFMYEDANGTRIAMVLRPMQTEKTMPMKENSIDAVGTVSWAAAGIGYSVVGSMPSRGLHPIADEVRRQIDGRT